MDQIISRKQPINLVVGLYDALSFSCRLAYLFTYRKQLHGFLVIDHLSMLAGRMEYWLRWILVLLRLFRQEDWLVHLWKSGFEMHGRVYASFFLILIARPREAHGCTLLLQLWLLHNRSALQPRYQSLSKLQLHTESRPKSWYQKEKQY